MRPANTCSAYVHKRTYRDGDGFLNCCGLTRIFAQRKCRGLDVLLAAALLLLMPSLAAAQGNPARPRITDRIDETKLTLLQGNTHPLARAQYDQGAAPPNLPMDRILLILKRSPEQEAALQDLLEQQQTSLSPNHHKWLTPDQFGQQFGPADQDVQVVTSWLTSQGFQAIQVSKGRNVIEFSGTAAQVESALHTAIHKYTVNGEDHWANVNDPQIPAALAPVVSGVLSLHNFPKKRLFVRSSQTASATLSPGHRPQITFTDGSHGLAPADFDKIYNVDSATMTGAGTTIAVVADSNILAQDISTFRNLFGLPANDSLGNPIPQIVLNGPDPGDLGGSPEAEAVLDVTWSGAVAPSATVKLVVSADTNSVNGVDLSEAYIVDNNLADIITESISVCESQNVSAGGFYGGMARQAAAQGITYLVASGDGGPDGCDNPSTVPSPLAAASVNLIASSPFAVAVGGTQFNDIANPTTYWNALNGTNSESAISYIPENAWNESCTGTACGGLGAGLWSSGGGQSTVFLKPSWQSGVTGIPSANARFLPDVSLTAAGHDGYAVCLAGSCQGSPPTFEIFGGTSASAQAFGGIMALVVQQKGRQGQANYVLYNLAAKEAAAPTLASCNGSNTSTPPIISTCVFNDTTLGNTNLTGETGFTAAAGYDEATGLGSVNVTNLISQWSNAIVTSSMTTLSLNNGAAVNITHGQSVPVSIAVAATPATPPVTAIPTGDVSLIAQIPSTGPGQGADGFTLTNTGSIPAGSTTILLPGSTTPYNIFAHYEGDKTFLASDSAPVSVIVNPEASLTSVNILVLPSPPGAFATSVVYGSPYILVVNVVEASTGTPCNPNGVGGPSCPTGTVTVKDGAALLDAGTFTLNSFGYFEDQPIQLSAGTHSISAAYAGDNSFSLSSTTIPDVVTVTQASTSTSVTASPTSVSVGGSVTLNATVATTSNATASAAQEPNGMVQFYSNGVALGSPVAVTGGVNSTTLFAQATASMSTTALPNGPDQITAKYLGDSNYALSPMSAAVTVGVGIPGVNLSSGCNAATIAISLPGQSGTCLITVMGANSFAGSVTLTCAVTASPAGAVDLPTCSFGVPDSNFTAPNTITLSATATTGNATMTAASTPYHAALFRPSNPPYGRDWPLAAAGIFLIYFCFLLRVPRRRRCGFASLAVLLVVLVAAVAGCGGGGYGGSGGSNPGTTVGTYTVTVTATPAGSTAQTTAITVNVQ